MKLDTHLIAFTDYSRAYKFQDALRAKGCKYIRLTTVHNRKNRNETTYNVSVPDMYYSIAKEIGWTKADNA